MPVPSSLNDLSTTAGANSPSGSETPGQGDDYLRVLSAFLAQIRDKLNGTSDTGTIKNATVLGTFTWPATITHNGDHTFGAALTVSGVASFNGNTVIGNATTDTLTIAPTAVTWGTTTTHSGAHIWSGAQTFNGGITSSGNATIGGVGNTLTVAGGAFAVDASANVFGRGVAVVAKKSAATSRASTTTLTADPELSVSLIAGVWAVTAYLDWYATGSGAGGVLAGLYFSGTVVSSSKQSATGTINSAAFVSSSNNPLNQAHYGGATLRLGGAGASNDSAFFTATVEVTTPGNLTVNWAQNSSNANALNLNRGSWLQAVQLS